jgi:hypothetical protein
LKELFQMAFPVLLRPMMADSSSPEVHGLVEVVLTVSGFHNSFEE